MDKSRATLLLLVSTLLLLLFSGGIILAYGQQVQTSPAPNGPPQENRPPRDTDTPRPLRFHRPPLERALRVGPPGRWWDNSDFVSKLGLTPDQQKKMDNIFQQSRLHLIDLMAAVQKQEVIMEPLLAADQPDEAKIIAQIDRVAQARADLEKANARMLLELRAVLTAEQWQKLRTEDESEHSFHGSGRFHPPGR